MYIRISILHYITYKDNNNSLQHYDVTIIPHVMRMRDLACLAMGVYVVIQNSQCIIIIILFYFYCNTFCIDYCHRFDLSLAHIYAYAACSRSKHAGIDPVQYTYNYTCSHTRGVMNARVYVYIRRS